METLQADPVAVGLVITLREASCLSASFVEALCARHDLTRGRCERHWFAAAALTDNPRGLHRALEAYPEVLQVDVVFVQLAETAETL